MLIVGTLPPPFGGTSVLLNYLLKELSIRDDVSCRVIDTSGFHYKLRVLVDVRRIISLIIRSLKYMRHCDVVLLHATTTRVPVTGTLLLLFSRLFRRPLIVRKFGGTDYHDLSFINRWLICHVMRNASMFLVETQKLIKRSDLEGFNNVRWFPNHRPIMPIWHIQNDKSKKCKRFVYLGHVRRDKGIQELIEAAAMLSQNGLEVDVYGPFYDGLSESIFLDKSNIHYCGVIRPEEVHEVLSRYDAMVFPPIMPVKDFQALLSKPIWQGFR